MKHFYLLPVFLGLSALVYSQEINTQQINALFDQIEKHHQGIGAIAISRQGEPVYKRSFGQADVNPVPPAAGYKYHIGSITKMLTATMIWQLHEKNRLDIDRKIDTFFPDIPNAGKINLSHLLGHSSGLKDFAAKGDSLIFWLMEPVGKDEIIREIMAQGVAFQPGDSIRYSNSGYFLLTRILEDTYKKSYSEILRENILSPLQLSHTESSLTDDETVARPYILNTDRTSWEETTDFYFPNVIGVGEVVSTPEELTRIVRALFNGELIHKESLEKMKPAPGKRFGKGLMHFPFYEKSFWGHGGDTFGTHSIAAYNEEDELAIGLCINGTAIPLNDILTGVLSTIYHKEYSLPEFTETTYQVSPETLAQYEGTYGAEGFPLKIRIFKEGNNLKAQATGQPSFNLEAQAEHHFTSSLARLEMSFNPEQQQLTFKQNGMEFTLTKE
jgi:D-alanyl-D-alanine carboxypeptidase